MLVTDDSMPDGVNCGSMPGLGVNGSMPGLGVNGVSMPGSILDGVKTRGSIPGVGDWWWYDIVICLMLVYN